MQLTPLIKKNGNKVSPEGIDLIKNMLQADTKKRYTAEQCLKHKWFTVASELKDNAERDPLDSDVLNNLMDFKGNSALKKAAMNLLVKLLNPKEINSLRKQFEKIDEDQSGNVSTEELSKALKKINKEIPDEEIEKIVAEIDIKGNHEINYSEFIAATLNAKVYLNESRLLMLFKEFDTDDSGYITVENLKEAFEKIR